MSGGGGFSGVRRSLAFARHIPPRQWARRLALTLRRGWRDRFGWRAPTAVPDLAPAPPGALFPPRSGMIAPSCEPFAFTFLGQRRAMPANAIDWGAPGPAPEHQLWRMNLHYMEYLEEVDDARFAALVESWIAANPPGRPGASKDSWNAYALSIRVVAWMQQWALRRERLPADTKARLLASLAVQLAFLEANLETDIGGNHLMKNVKALLWGSAFFAGAAATRWRGLGLRLLRSALRTQALADGVHYERSPSYHAQVFADLLECRAALGAAESPPELDAALRAMAVATADLVHPDSGVAQFNDAGLSMAYRPAECLDVFQRQFGERPAPRAHFAFPAAGYFGRRDGGNFFVADCGAIGPDALPAHAHGDILSFEWSVGGQRLIVDQGVYEYIAGARRDASRAAASHNTLSIEGADQADFFGAFRCGRRPRATVLRLENDARRLVLEGTHDGYGAAARHWRRFEVDAEGVSIHDRIEAPAGRKAAIGFLLHPEVGVEAEGDGLILTRGPARVEMRSQAKIVVEDAVWWPDMGYEQATKRLRIPWDRGPADIVTTLRVRSDGRREVS